MAITLRNTKGTALTHVELDANFTTLQNADLDSAAVTSIAQALDNAQVIPTHINTLAGDSDVDFGSKKIYYANMWDSEGALPNATTYHGMFAHVHNTGAGYFAHGGAWVRLANNADLGTGIDSAKTISLIDSAYVQAREGVDSIGELSNVNMSGISNNKILKWDSAQGMFIAATDVSGGGGGGGLTYADFSVSVASAGTANLSYNNGTGVYTYTPPDLSSYLTSYTVTEGDVTAHQAALSITESQISDLQSYLTSETSHADVLVDGDFASAGFMKTDGSGNYSIDNGTYVSQGSSIDMNGTELVLDIDGDTSLHASTDDKIDIRVGGTDVGYFNSTGLVVDNITSQATGTPTLTASTDINMVTSGSVTVSQNSGAGGGFRVGNMTTSERNALSASNGEIIYNTTNNQMEIYEHSAWHPMTKGSHVFNVGNSGASDYTFSDPENHWFTSTTNDPVLYLRRGETYYFVVNASGHPFQIRTSNGGSAYADGVTGNTQAVGTVVFKVPMGAPSTLYYQCTAHSGMGNTINIV
tara:strand:- start:649 stop:2232 length:1584 start_codon:yes stop_codon:yes gene_type:complete